MIVLREDDILLFFEQLLNHVRNFLDESLGTISDTRPFSLLGDQCQRSADDT
jgi:hypothetical protein